MEPSSHVNSNSVARWLAAKNSRLAGSVAEIRRDVVKVGKEDPRRIVHGMKVGLAITLISLLYYFKPVFEGFGVAAMWAVLTVVVVFEFSVGATLGKGLNRVFATGFGGLLGVGAHSLASLPGEKAEIVILALFVFLLASVVTFLRFFPKLKARYDYGLMIIILTFSLVSVSGYQDDEVVDQAIRRMSTIVVGSSAAVAICILICPVWAGTDLHNLIANNLERIANFFQEFGVEYFMEPVAIADEKKEFMEGYKSILNSKSSEDSLVTFAKWEFRHGRFRYRHPWDHYQKIGNLTRQLACTLEALNSCFHSENQAPAEVKTKIEGECKKMSSELGKAMKELSMAMKNMTHPSVIAKTHIQNSQRAAKTLNTLLNMRLWGSHSLSDVLPAAKVASLLLDTVAFSVKISDSVQELAKLAGFEDVEECSLVEASDSSAYQMVTIDGEGPSSFPVYREPGSLDMVHQTGE